eukprot:8332796-Ditylum_brightwellii.AAC.2
MESTRVKDDYKTRNPSSNKGRNYDNQQIFEDAKSQIKPDPITQEYKSQKMKVNKIVPMMMFKE